MFHLSDQGVIYYDFKTLTSEHEKRNSDVTTFVLSLEDITKLYGPVNTQKVKHNPSYYIKSRSKKAV